jgi:hypothetical protein
MSNIDKKIIEEINRYNSINKYIVEQAAPAPEEDLGAPALPPAETPALPPAEGATPPPTTETAPEFVDIKTDTDVEKLGKSSESSDSGTEELDVTELVTGQKELNQKQDEYFNQLFQQLENLESKLGEMDTLINTVNSLEAKLEKYRPKTPQEKLELRSLDSGPFNQKLTDFFADKEPDMEKTGKNEYILTKDEVENFSPSEIKGTFNVEDPYSKKNFGF